MKTSPIYLDRLEKALIAGGFKGKRSAILEIAAQAFGYHNSNEFSAAAKRGDLDPPPVQPIGVVALPNGQRVILVTDTLAAAPYGIDEAFVEQVIGDERAERIGVTPYGHLAWLGDLADQTIPEFKAATDSGPGVSASPTSNQSEADLPADAFAVAARSPATILPQVKAAGSSQKVTIHTALHEHRFGTTTFASWTRDGLLAELAEHCRSFWTEVAGRRSGDYVVPETPESMSDREIIDAYFEVNSNESYTFDEADVAVTPELLTALRVRTDKPLRLSDIIAPGHRRLVEIADALTSGAGADIWFHAHDFQGEESAHEQIVGTQEAMHEAARILQSLATLTEVPPVPALAADKSCELSDSAEPTGETEECRMGLCSWVGETGKLPPTTQCTRCGDLYGHPD
ncbi:hypothetical protein [Sphingosinicella sp. BN140058]|uniref:hypothetical protein n=1 Tax=Sphingosinicella sp. BN140058 TaxID=1892855 RepID=UPI001012F95A|nr:hypothetical protein [Sphingosinicella sp. BN140058]QAY80483.1 hypothetical protein ETR14_27990 [Sphingosinicella sp. BN140058]